MRDQVTQDLDHLRIERLERELETAISERDKAIRELAEVRRDAQWTMGHLKIADILNTGVDAPAAGDGWLPLWKADPDGADRKRLEFINTHGRVALGNGNFLVALPILRAIGDDATIPTPYNIRHIIDLCQEP